MIVDDKQLVRETYRDLFQAEDFAIIEASNGAEALLWLQGAKADIILLDLEVSVMGGRSFLEYRLTHPRIDKIPVLVLISPLEDAILRQSLLNLGANRLLEKPVHVHDLVAAVRQTLLTARISDPWPPTEVADATGRLDARVTFTIPIRVRTGSFEETSGRLRDLSAGGLGAYFPRPLRHGDTITISIDTKGRSLVLTGFVQWAGGSLTNMGYPHGIRFPVKQQHSFPLYTYSFFRQDADFPD